MSKVNYPQQRLDAIRAKRDSGGPPAPMTYWRHKDSGEGFRVERLANERASSPDFPLTITLCRLADGGLFVFPANKWAASFEVDAENTL